jgi:hypothetical protein
MRFQKKFPNLEKKREYFGSAAIKDSKIKKPRRKSDMVNMVLCGTG